MATVRDYQVSRYQKGKNDLHFEATDNEWQWHQLGHMQACIWLQTDSYASTPPLSFLQGGCPSCRPTNSIKALKASSQNYETTDAAKNVVTESQQQKQPTFTRKNVMP